MSKLRKDLVFIVSGGRTGTQFLGDRISMAIEDSFSVHDPDILSIYVRRVLERIRTFGLYNMTIGKTIGRTGVRSIGQRLISERIDRKTALNRLERLRQKFHASIDQPLVVESNSQWLYVCDELMSIWPHARIIVIVRDPRTWIRSWLNKGIRWRTYDPVRLLPPGRLTPAKIGDRAWADKWKSFGIVGRLAWEWRFVYSRLQEHAENNLNARIFRFEDLFHSEDETSMQELVKFAATHPDRKYYFNLPKEFTEKVQNASHGTAPDWRQWRPDQARLVDSLCGTLMTKFGYGHETSWKEKLKGS